MNRTPSESKPDLAALQERIGYRFRDANLLQNAMTHASYLSGNGSNEKGRSDNERLEFLGDAVLELCVSEYLFTQHGEMDEGYMTRARAAAVCEDALFQAAQHIDLGSAVFLGAGEHRSGGAQKPSILSDAMEALIAAVFLDGGYQAARDLVHRFAPASIEDSAVHPPNDAKTRLQEYLQRDGSVSIQYKIVAEQGPAHDKHFVARVDAGGKTLGEGQGHSKKEAEQAAASQALGKLGVEV